MRKIFFYPITDDLDTIDQSVIELVLPDPHTKRDGKQQYYFDANFPEGTQ